MILLDVLCISAAADVIQDPNNPNRMLLQGCVNHDTKNIDRSVTITNGFRNHGNMHFGGAVTITTEFKNHGAIDIDGAVTITGGCLVNHGAITFNSHVTIAHVDGFKNHGRIYFNQGVTVTGNGGRFVNYGIITCRRADVAAAARFASGGGSVVQQ